MARPRKCRRICSMPKSNEFYPGKEYFETIKMTVDEFETIRLIDYEGLFQEQCAIQMNVSRATVTSIYDSARKKIADALVNGKRLVIEGGDFTVCENSAHCCGHCGHGCNKQCENINCALKK